MTIVTISEEFDKTKKQNEIQLISKEISYFSNQAGKVTLDKSQLNPYHLKQANMKSFANPFGWNTKLGSNNYIPKVFAPDESTIGDFLDSLTQIAKNSNMSNIDLQSYHVFCPSSFLQYIATKRESRFYIIYENNRYIIANSETRVGQDVLMSYAGIRFEDLLTHGPSFRTRNNLNLYESIIETKLAGLKCLYCAEIDTVGELSGLYTEVKMILLKSHIPHAKTNDKNYILTCIQAGNRYFSSFLFRLLVQCKFSNIHNVLIGVRDTSFTIRNITEFSVDQDLLPFFKQHCRNYVEKYNIAIELIERVLEVIKLKVNDENPVFVLRIGTSIDLSPITDQKRKEKIKNTVFIPEFTDLLKSFS